MPPLFHTGFVTVLFIGVALSMDAFSLGLALGSQGMRWRDIARLSMTISYFHILLPLVSIMIGDYLYSVFGDTFSRLAALVMMFLGAKMAVTAIRQNSMRDGSSSLQPQWAQILGLGFTVSIDALSVGFSLGTLPIRPIFAALMFGLLSGLFALSGLALGKKVSQVLGQYGQLVGGFVLMILGLKFFF